MGRKTLYIYVYARRRCLWAMLSLGVVPVWAQREGRAMRSDTLRNVEVVSTQRDRDIKSTSPQYALTNDNFHRLGVTDIGDALHRLPGITLRDYGGAGGMKTVSVRGLGAQNTGVSYDGIALSDCQTGQIDLQRYTLSGIKDLRLVVAGNDDVFLPARNVASAAMLSINTLTDLDLGAQPHGKAQLTLGSWGYTNPMVQFGTSMGNKLSMSGVVDYVYAENDYPFTLTNVQLKTREHRTNSRMNQWHGEVNLLYRPNNRNRLTAKAYYYDNDRQLPGIVHYYINDNDETLLERNAFVQARWVNALSEKVSLMANGKFNWAMSDYHNGIPSGGISSSTYWQREAYGAVAALYTPSDWLSLDYSADYVMNNLNSSLSVDSRPRRHSLLQTVVAKASWQRLTLLARGLYALYLNEKSGNNQGNSPTTSVGTATIETEDDEHNFAPSVSASYRLLPNDDVFVRASWKHIFRMPTFNELYYYHLGNPMLSPERTSQWNVGVSWLSRKEWAVKASLTVDGYLNRVTDKIVAIPYNMFVWRTVNIGRVKVLGLDVTADVEVPLSARHSLGLTGNYSLQRAKNQSFQGKFYGYQIAYTPKHSGSVTLSWTNPWVNVSATADGMSSRWTTNEHTEGTRMEGFMELSMGAYRTFRIQRVLLTVRASVLNITDKQYDIVMHYPMPGRSWKMSLSAAF
ncbi:MAG: TonB-dependent receptor [Bacteroidaceae bacterium]|nr:TonB-dependent receptor [Bacteroidaceae bacterium]